MENSIYTYVDQFPEFASKILESQDITDIQFKKPCEDFRDSKLTTYNGDKPQFIKECTKIVKYLEDNKSNANFKPAFCKYINYWLYDTLEKMDPFSSNALLDAFYSNIGKLNICQTYKNHIEKEIYDDLKELYNLHEHLIKYKKESKQAQDDSCVHAKNGAELYESHVDKCKWMHNYGYCSSLKKFRDVYENHRTEENKCSVNMQYLTPFTSFGAWLRPRLPGGKHKTKKLEKKMQDLRNTSDVRNSRYTLPYHSSQS
ncbi:Plasmodium vivax Vir protein, putative [Plasmodium vivax]|uniref:Vir protein, putative n=1 Tax=Plasmodium vivax TaxID=5855 RepID=A0A1G4E3Q0_PLAVI|nr:Plasmodium vivax Vir protein, putative [Plasmodium vivax]